MKQLLSEISQAGLNLVFPIYCEGCNVKLPYDNKDCLCRDCRSRIKINSPPFCIRCGRCLSGDEDIRTVCLECINKSFFFDAARQCCVYDGLVKDLIHSFKYSRKLFLKDILADILSGFADRYIDCKELDLIVPVPMHRSCINARGFNQAALLARRLSKLLGIACAEGCLIKVKNTGKQAGLSKKDRLRNLKGAFSFKRGLDVRSKRLLLIDDVFTTGSTADECSKALKDAGAASIFVLALARGV